MALLGLGPGEQNTMHQLPITGEELEHFCPSHLGISITKNNTEYSSTGCNNALFTRDKASSASIVSVVPTTSRSLLAANREDFVYVHPSHATVGEPHPILTGQI